MIAPSPAALEAFIGLLETHRTDLVTVSLAQQSAGDLGLRHRLLCSLTLQRRVAHCMLSTTDPDAMLVAGVPGRRRPELGIRHQVGEGSWQYDVPLGYPFEEFALELERGGEARMLRTVAALRLVDDACQRSCEVPYG